MTWTTFLDEYEATIESTLRALDNDGDLDPRILRPFEAPTDLGPLPHELHERTAEVIRRNGELQARLAIALEDIGQELGAVRREGVAVNGYSPTSNATVSKYFDRPV